MSQLSLAEVSEIQQAPRLDPEMQDGRTTGTDSQTQAHDASNEVFSDSSAPMQKFTKMMYAAIDVEDYVKLTWSLEQGAVINAQRGRPLRNAASSGNTAIIELLIHKGATVSLRNKDGRTALHRAILKCHEAAVGVLLKHGADANALGNSGLALLHYAACYRHGDAAIAKLLLDYGAKVEATVEEDDGGTLSSLQMAASTGDVQLAETLLNGGAKINRCDMTGLPALHFAVVKGQYRMANFLLRSGAHPNLRSGTVVMACASSNKFVEDWTPLHWAAFLGDDLMVLLLLDYDADINMRTGKRHCYSCFRDTTALHLAALCPAVSQPRADYKATVRILVEEGADVAAEDYQNYTAVKRAKQKKRYKSEPQSSIAAALIPILKNNHRLR